MGIMVYSLLWVMEDLYHQPELKGLRVNVWSFGLDPWLEVCFVTGWVLIIIRRIPVAERPSLFKELYVETIIRNPGVCVTISIMRNPEE